MNPSHTVVTTTKVNTAGTTILIQPEFIDIHWPVGELQQKRRFTSKLHNTFYYEVSGQRFIIAVWIIDIFVGYLE